MFRFNYVIHNALSVFYINSAAKFDYLLRTNLLNLEELSCSRRLG